MKATETTEKQFNAVKFMRDQREKLSRKLYGMSKAEIVEYFQRRKKEATVKPSA